MFCYGALLTSKALNSKCLLRDHQKQQTLCLHREPVLHHSHWVSSTTSGNRADLATDYRYREEQKPIKNQVGAAIVERILRAARNGEKYKMMVMMPSVPAFAGDLKSDDALGTRAIMEFQYDSINRGGHSIYETIAKAGFNPMDYIRFFNLRNYDRINASGAMRAAEERSGVSYEQAREERDAEYEGSRGQYQAYRPPPTSEYGVYEMDANTQGHGRYEMDAGYGNPQGKPADEQYQQGAAKIGGRQGLGSGRWDSVAECYMLGGEDIRNVPWEGGAMDEIDAFVSEELYIHSKVSSPSITTYIL